jgi:Ca-activated chloride channel family protein
MSFSSPLWLLALASVPAVLALHGLGRRRRRRYALRFPAVETLRLAAGPSSTWRRRLPIGLVLAALAALALALARPTVAYQAAVDQASVMLVTDHSGSMAASDVQPTRLYAAERAANTFIDQLPSKAKVGAIAFSSSPDQVQGPVTTQAAARNLIDSQTADGATDTGDALALALQLLHGTLKNHPPAAIVLLSDGAANAGLDPMQVARQAAQEKIPIYTVALGMPGATIPNPDPFGPPLDVSPDPQLMANLARVTGARTFNAKSAGELSSIYKQLGAKLGSVTRHREVTAAFAAAGLVLLLAGAAASARWAGRLP